MNRRGFLQSCLVLAAAPAIVRAESLMKIWVPPQNIGILSPDKFHIIQVEQSWLGIAKTQWILDGNPVDAIRGVSFECGELAIDNIKMMVPKYEPGKSRLITLTVKQQDKNNILLANAIAEESGKTTLSYQPWSVDNAYR